MSIIWVVSFENSIIMLILQSRKNIKKGEFSSAGSEHLPYKQRVGGSNPSTPTKSLKEIWGFFYAQALLMLGFLVQSINYQVLCAMQNYVIKAIVLTPVLRPICVTARNDLSVHQRMCGGIYMGGRIRRRFVLRF